MCERALAHVLSVHLIDLLRERERATFVSLWQDEDPVEAAQDTIASLKKLVGIEEQVQLCLRSLPAPLPPSQDAACRCHSAASPLYTCCSSAAFERPNDYEFM
jgi:hypothetical protein